MSDESTHFSIALGDWVVMPNHLHGIIILHDDYANGVGDVRGRGEASGRLFVFESRIFAPDASPLRARPPSVKYETQENPSDRPNGTESGSLGAIIQNFKSITTRRVNNLRPKAASGSLWQRNYQEHIIRNDQEWERTSQRIIANPIRWDEEKNLPPEENDQW